MYVAAVEMLRADSTPYHLANGLLDHVAWLQGAGDAEGMAEAMIAEAADIDDARACVTPQPELRCIGCG